MPTPKLSAELADQAYNLFIQHGRNTTLAANALGVPRSTFQNRVEKGQLRREMASRGELGFSPVLPGFAIKSTSSKAEDGTWITQSRAPGGTFEVPKGHHVRGVSALIDQDGRELNKWVKTAVGPMDPQEYAKSLADAFENFSPSADPVPSPHATEDLLVLFPWADPHFGSMIWRGDASENWDLKTAVAAFKTIFARVIDRSPPAKNAILLVGGDTLHSDTSENVTPTGKNPLQVDGRHPKVFLTACETIAQISDMMLRKFENVEIIVLAGNHDITSAAPISFFLHAWFRNEPRVTVDISAQPFRFRKFGACHFGFTHGHTVKPGQMAQIMAQYDAKSWGQATFRYAHTFHIHSRSKIASEGGGCLAETHQIIAPSDAWAYARGLSSGRSLQSIAYSPTRGECGRTIEMI